MTTPESRLAAHVAGLAWRDVPASARDRFVALLADYVACVLTGLRSVECRRIAAAATAEGGRGAGVAGGGTASPRAAAMANAALAHWFEMDDVHDPGAVHVGAVIFPVMIAAAELRGMTDAEHWPEFAAAAIAAIDVCGRLGEALQRWTATAWMPTGFACPIGAAAGAARLAGLGIDGIHAAAGLAAAGGALLRQPLADRTSGKNVLCAQAAGRALDAAALTAAGIAGAPNFLTGRFGLVEALTGGRAGLDGLADLGRRFTVDEVSLKPFACCRAAHAPIDLALRLVRAHDLRPDAIAEVRVEVPESSHAMCGAPFEPGADPRVAAQFSIAYTVALALAHGDVALRDFAGEVGRDARLLALARRVVSTPYALPPGGRGLGARVALQVTTHDGRTLAAETSAVVGSPACPMDDAAIERKFAEAAREALDAPAIGDLRAALDDLPRRGLAPVLRGLADARWLAHTYGVAGAPA